jgi:hypothetical protein
MVWESSSSEVICRLAAGLEPNVCGNPRLAGLASYSCAVMFGCFLNQVKKFCLPFILTAISAASVGTSSAKAIPALMFVSPPPSGSRLLDPPHTLGWSFNLSQSYIVDALGVYDSVASGDGLVDSHDIGLWDSTGNLLASVTGVTGDSYPLVDRFRYASLSSNITLPPGEYYIGATYPFKNDPQNDPFDPHIGTFEVVSVHGVGQLATYER